MSKIKLEKIGLETADGQSVSLTIKEAKELYDQLHELFGEKVKYVPSTPIYIDRWYEKYSRPYPAYADWQYRPGIVTYFSNDTNMKLSYSGTAT